MHMCAYIQLYIGVYMCIYVVCLLLRVDKAHPLSHIHVYIYTCACIHTYMCIYTNVCVYRYAYTNICI